MALTACAAPSGAGTAGPVATPVLTTTATSAGIFHPDPDPKYAAAVTAVDPLSAGRTVSCAGAVQPVAILAMTGDASRGSSPTATALRNFLADDPWHGMDGVDHTGKNTNWLLLEANAGRYVFAQRKGPVGMGSVIVLTKKVDGNYVPEQNGSCLLQLDTPDEHRATISSATVTANTVTIHWLNGACGIDAPPDEVLLNVEQQWTPTGTHLLVVTGRNPAIPTPVSAAPTAASAAQTSWCGGVGIDSVATLSLDKPAAGGRLYDDAAIPAQLVDHR